MVEKVKDKEKKIVEKEPKKVVKSEKDNSEIIAKIESYLMGYHKLSREDIEEALMVLKGI